MLRDFLENKWILTGAVLLIPLDFACFLWYQQDIAPLQTGGSRDC